MNNIIEKSASAKENNPQDCLTHTVNISGSDLINELKWRGLFFQSTNEQSLAKMLDKPVKFYCGFDPTAPSLHHGNLVQLIMMRHLQNAGHQPYCIVGGATGLIGDPRQSGERTLNPAQTVREWAEKLTEQFKRFLIFALNDSQSKPQNTQNQITDEEQYNSISNKNPARVLNNYDWTASISALEFLRDIGKNFRMGNMLAKDTVKSRLENDGLSYTEFSYQVLQGFDYNYLYQNYGITLQTGGQDQWGNLMSGLDLIHRVNRVNTDEKINEQSLAHVITTPLITKSDGTKFGKSEGGAIWLNADMMSPYEFYQFWLNIEDSEAIKLLKVFTFLTRDQIDAIEAEFTENPGQRLAQKTLAEEITTFVHGSKELEQAKKASLALFGNEDLGSLEPSTLNSVIQSITQVEGNVGSKIGELFINAKLSSSFGDFRRTFDGYYLNNQKLKDVNQEIVSDDLIIIDDSTKIAFLRKGKRNICALVVKNV